MDWLRMVSHREELNRTDDVRGRARRVWPIRMYWWVALAILLGAVLLVLAVALVR